MEHNTNQSMDPMTIEVMLNRLASREDDGLVHNFYNSNQKDNHYRLENLKNYLAYYEMHPPKYILIGEAPGYKGCALSGIPFTSLSVISTSKFFISNNLRLTGGMQKENTATIMWRLFDELDHYPLLWNAFPFHPHHSGSLLTNRKPNIKEIAEGLYYINALKDSFPDATLVAVGNVAFQSLTSLKLAVKKVRHPSYGGKHEFYSNMKQLII